MKVNFTKEEYRLLLEALYLSDWVLHSHAINQEDFNAGHEELKNKLLSYFEEMGANDLIEQSEDGYHEVRAFDEYIHEKFIDPYEDDVFWFQLIDRLAERDVINNIGLENYKALSGMERVNMVEELKEYYANEFEQHGLNFIKIDHSELARN